MKSQQLRRLRGLIHEAKILLGMPSQQRPDDVNSNANDLQTKIKRQDRAAERFMGNFQDVRLERG